MNRSPQCRCLFSKVNLIIIIIDFPLNSVKFDDLSHKRTYSGSFGNETTKYEKSEIALVKDDVLVGNKIEETDLCRCCYKNKVNSMLIPCNHVLVCYSCANLQSKALFNRCSMCLTKVQSFIKIYKS